MIGGPIFDIASGLPWSLALKGGKTVVDRILKLDPGEQLLWIVHDQFGDELGLDRKEVLGWLKVDGLGDAVLAVVAGNLTKRPEQVGYLADQIETELESSTEMPEARRAELASEVAEGMFLLAPYIKRDPDQATAHVSNKLDQFLEAVGGAEEDAPGAAEALLRGPLVQVGMTREAKQAAELIGDGQLVEAAELLEKIAQALSEVGLATVAETYLIAASEGYRRAERTEEAVSLMRKAAEGQVARRSSEAFVTVRKLAELLPTDRAWEVEALAAVTEFAYDPQGAVAALRVAYEKRRETGDGTAELAAYCDVLLFFGQHDVVREVTEEPPAGPPTSEDDLRVRLARLDALGWDADVDTEALNDQWQDLLRALDTGDQPTQAGVAWQRRGLTLAHSDDVSGSEDAYRRAMKAFASVPGYEEQVADGLYSLQAAALLNGEKPADMASRSLAFEQRGLAEAPVARADDLSRLGMAHRIAEKHREALRTYSCSLQLHQAAGSLQGHLEVNEKLGELFDASGRPALATSHYIAAGQAKKAAAAGKRAKPDDLSPVLKAEGARWEEAATLAVIAAVGANLPDKLVSDLAPRVIELAGQEPERRAPSPVHQARLALPALLVVVPDRLRAEAVSTAEAALTSPHFELRWAAEEHLEQATRLDLAAAGSALIDSFIEEPHNSRVSLDFVAKQVKQDAGIAARVRAAATDVTPALAALTIAGRVKGDDELEAAATETAKGLSETVNVRQDEQQSSVEDRSFEVTAIAIRHSAVEARREAIDRLLTISQDDADSELNRQSAASGLLNLAEAIPDDQIQAIFDGLSPLARGEYALSQWDKNITDPLAFFRFSLHHEGSLWSAALGACGRMLEVQPGLSPEDFKAGVERAIERGPARAAAAAVDALGRATSVPVPVPLEMLLCSSDEAMRFSALGAWTARREDLPDEDLLERLINDGSIAVRQRLALLVGERGRVEPLERLAKDDSNGLIRRVAARELARISDA